MRNSITQLKGEQWHKKIYARAHPPTYLRDVVTLRRFVSGFFAEAVARTIPSSQRKLHGVCPAAWYGISLLSLRQFDPGPSSLFVSQGIAWPR